jgi:hypothetical protein
MYRCHTWLTLSKDSCALALAAGVCLKQVRREYQLRRRVTRSLLHIFATMGFHFSNSPMLEKAHGKDLVNTGRSRRRKNCKRKFSRDLFKIARLRSHGWLRRHRGRVKAQIANKWLALKHLPADQSTVKLTFDKSHKTTRLEKKLSPTKA